MGNVNPALFFDGCRDVLLSNCPKIDSDSESQRITKLTPQGFEKLTFFDNFHIFMTPLRHCPGSQN